MLCRVLAILLLLHMGLSEGFCSAYAPASGSRFRFPARRCLTDEFLAIEFGKGTFGQTRIVLAKDLRNVTYNGRSFPLALEASYGWESGHAISAVVDILLREVLGVETEFVCTWGSIHAQKLLGGCQDPQSGSACTFAGVPQLDPPLAHISVESWVTTPAENDEMNTYNTNLGMLGYYSKSGLYMHQYIADSAFRAEGLSLEWWQTYSGRQVGRQYFDTYTDVAHDIMLFSGGRTAPKCTVGNTGHDELLRHGYNCSEGWFFAPACVNNTQSCIPVVLAEYDWDCLVQVESAIRNNYPFAITWIGASWSFTFGVRSTKRLLFYCASTTAVCHERPLAMVFQDTHAPIGRPDLVTSLLKVVWRKLEVVDQDVNDFMMRLTFPTDDLVALMTAYAGKISPSTSSTQTEDEFVPEIACNWVRNMLRVDTPSGTSTGDNTAKWAQWIPRTCSLGHYYDKANSKCLPCALGEQSSDGRKCLPCPEGTFAAKPGMPFCDLCDVGTWQDGSTPMSCKKCPMGSYRGVTDQGCRLCHAGKFGPADSLETCHLCSSGSWSSSAGSTTCAVCPSSTVTPFEGAMSPADCVCAVDMYWPCKVSSDLGHCTVSARLHQTLACEPCPGAFSCAGGKVDVDNVTLHAQPILLEGHYATKSHPYQAYLCLHAGLLCEGGGEDKCRGGRAGFQCIDCQDGFAATAGSSCRPCSSSGTYLPPIACVMGFVALAGMYKLSARKRGRYSATAALAGTLGILVGNTQLFSVMATFSIDWPITFTRVLRALSFLVLSPDILSISCYTGHGNFTRTYLPGFLAPLVVVLMLLVLVCASSILSRITRRVHPMGWAATVNTLGLVMLAMYVGICKSTFNIFTCRTNPSAPDTMQLYDGYLCLGEAVRPTIPLAIVGVIVYIFASLALFIYVVAVTPSRYQVDEGFRMQYRFLLDRWHPEVWYWGVLNLIRNVLVSLVPAMTTDGQLQLLLVMVFVFPLFVAQLRIGPWRDGPPNTQDSIMTASLLLTSVVGMALQVPSSPGIRLTLAHISLALYLTACCCALAIVAQFAWLSGRACFTRQHTRQIATARPSVVLERRNSLTNVVLPAFERSQTLESWQSTLDASHSHASIEVSDFLSILFALQLLDLKNDNELTHLVAEFFTELPPVDLKLFMWASRHLSYNLLGNATMRPQGAVLAPFADRTFCPSGRRLSQVCSSSRTSLSAPASSKSSRSNGQNLGLQMLEGMCVSV